MVQGPNPTPFEVGRAFVHQYYTLLHQAPEMLHRFYSTDSTFIHGGVDRAGAVEQPAVGPDNISKRINELNLRDCHAKIRQVDSHPTIGSGVVVQVTGELSNNGDPMRRFMQTFVLAPRQPKKYYVQNDIFRYQDEVFDEGSDEDDRSSSQVYGDTDKVSNADSSVVAPQPSPLNNNTNRPTSEEPQPLPPRRPVPIASAPPTQNQVINDANLRQPKSSLVHDSSSEYQEQQETPVPLPTESQPSKPVSTEGASYAGIIKANASTGVSSVTTPSNTGNATSNITAPTVAPNPPRSVPNKFNSNRPTTGNAPRSHADYRQNTRGYQWSDNNAVGVSGQSDSRGHSTSFTAPNEQQVFVGSLPPHFSQEDLKECFSQYGEVIDVKLNNLMSDHKKNYGFVVFTDPEVASKVVQLQHVAFKGNRLNVEPKTQKGANAPGNMRNSNYRGRGGQGGTRGPYRGGGGPRRGGGGYRNDSMTFNASSPDENNKVPNQS